MTPSPVIEFLDVPRHSGAPDVPFGQATLAAAGSPSIDSSKHRESIETWRLRCAKPGIVVGVLAELTKDGLSNPLRSAIEIGSAS